MPVRTADLNGNPYIGVFCRALSSSLLCPAETTEDLMALAEDTLGYRAVRCSLGGTNLHGSLIASNRNGAIVPHFISTDELSQALKEAGVIEGEGSYTVASSEDPVTAWGNNVLCSDKVALVNPEVHKRSLKLIEDVLGVEPVVGTIAGVRTVGSVAVLNSKGMVVHPKARTTELERLKELFGVDVQISTANFGSPYLGACMVANDRGCLVGSNTSGIELNRIENTLDLF